MKEYTVTYEVEIKAKNLDEAGEACRSKGGGGVGEEGKAKDHYRGG